MMRWGYRGKLLLASVGVVVVALVLADVLLGRVLERDLLSRVETDLEVRLALVEARVAAAPPPTGDLPAWDAVADQAGKASGVRVTFVAPDGRVLGDSEVSLEALQQVDNHARRDEVAEALESGRGTSRRRSSTVDRWMLYKAARSPATGVVVRLALPLTELEEARGRLHWLLAGGSILALFIAIALSVLTAQVFGRSLQTVIRAARRIADGDLDVRIRPETRDEIGQLGATLDHLAESLSTSLHALRDERDRLGSILEAMEEGVLVVGPERSVTMANPAARVLLLSGAPSSTDVEARRVHAQAPLEGRTLLEIVRSTDLDAIVGRTLSTGQPSSGEIAVDHPRARRLLVRSAPFGSPGAVVVLVDVTEIRRLEAIRKDFVANVSHELRTPVTAVRTALETARAVLAQGEPTEADRFLDIVDRHTERLTLLVRDLLDLSRAESGNLALASGPVDIAEVTNEVIEVFGEPAARRSLRLTVALPDHLPPVQADRGALVQVLTNLIENAVKYTDEGGRITVSASSNAGVVDLSVTDSGPGIPAKHLPRLFERFYRIDPGRSRDRGGTGLGLSIVKHLAEAMRGSVTVKSAPGQGSTFAVRLPRATGRAESPPSPPKQA
jgi:two-component system phosphate regulon sensor histidine kinase PhoR